MPTLSISETTENKKRELAKWLETYGPEWPYSDRQDWAIRNGYNTDAVRKQYFQGKVGSIPVAENLKTAITAWMKANGKKVA